MKTIFVILLMGIMSVTYAQPVITRTISIDSSVLADIRASLNNTDPNYDSILNENSLTRAFGTDFDQYDLPTAAHTDGYNRIMNAANILDKVIFGSTYSIQFDNYNDVLSLLNTSISTVQEIMNYFTGIGYSPMANAATRGLCMANLCINASYLYDCLYYKQYDASGNPDPAVILAVNKLQQVMLGCINLMEDAEDFYQHIYNGSEPGYLQYQHGVWAKDFLSGPSGYLHGEPPYPGLNLHQYRLNMYGAAGLAALLIAESTSDTILQNQMNQTVDYIDDRLTSDVIPDVFPMEDRKPGMLAFHTSNSGAYNESIAYAGFLLKYVTPYFVARKRLSGGQKNYFENQYLRSWINDMAKKMLPSGNGDNMGYNWNYNDSYNQPGFHPGVLSFFYHGNSNDLALKENVAWMINCSFDNPSNKYKYIESGSTILQSPFIMRFSSEPNCNPKIPDFTMIPSFIQEGTWSNAEFTILRPPSNSMVDYLSSTSMNIVHENSWCSEHAHADQTSYTFHSNGDRYLLDSSGESFSDLHWWRKSPYAHNMIIVDPLPETIASLYSSGHPLYRPVSGIQDYNKATFTAPEIEPDACQKEFFNHLDSFDVLRLGLNYRDPVDTNLPFEEQQSECFLQRSFFRENDAYVVYDKIDTLDDTCGHEFWNLLHFDSISVGLNDNTYSVFKGGTVDVACGSFDASFTVESCENKFSEGQPYRRGKMKLTNSTDSSFMTVIVPRLSPASRIVEKSTNINNSYCIALSGTTRSLPFSPTVTYIGCTNGADQAMNLAGGNIHTNADMFMATTIPGMLPMAITGSVVLYGGDYLSIHNEDLIRTYSSDIQMITATYESNALKVIVEKESVSYPRFKMFRSDIQPSDFSVTLRSPMGQTGTIPFPYPDDPDYGFIDTDIIQSLAYDNRYYYVNYSWADLQTAGLLSNNLVLVKGTIPQTELNANLNIRGEVRISGNLTINEGVSLHIEIGSNVTVDDAVGIVNHGMLSVDGSVETPITIANSNTRWAGITTYRRGNLQCEYVTICGADVGIQIRGQANITNCEIRDCNSGISIETSEYFTLNNSTIKDNAHGIVISNNYSPSSYSRIQDCDIFQNGTGILMYGSNTLLRSNNIHHNYRRGMFLCRGSEPVIRNTNVSYTEDYGYAQAEIRLESDSYPVIDEGFNDINCDGMGYSLLYGTTGRIKPLMATQNYWGSTEASEILQWIYPAGWVVKYDPFSFSPNTSYNPVIVNPFKQALWAEENGDISLAKQLYTTVISTEPDSLHALQSLGRLNSLCEGNQTSINELRGIYGSFKQACSDSILIRSAEVKEVMLDRFDGMYVVAVQEYDDLMNSSATELDSLLCQMDIAYTLQDMYYDDHAKGESIGISYHSQNLNISNLKDANSAIMSLWERMLSSADTNASYAIPIPTKLELKCYPNPFNPSTTVAFSVPEYGSVKLSIYNLRGQKVKDLINTEMQKGFHKAVWDGTDAKHQSVSSGLYLLRLETAKGTSSRKVMLLK